MLKKLLILLLLAPVIAAGQLVVTNTQTPQDLVQNVLLGQGVGVSNIQFNGGPGNVLTQQAGFFDSNMANVGINSGILLSTGNVIDAVGPNNMGGTSTDLANSGMPFCDPDLALLDPTAMSFNDCAILEFDFIPTGDTLRFNFVFASEEYLEFVNSINDAFGFFLSGPGIAGPFTNGAENLALIPGTTNPVTINGVNNVVNSAFYVDNGDGFTAPFNVDPFFVEFDGLTTVLTAEALVQCGVQYHIKLVVADNSDGQLDSGVFLEAGSFASFGQVSANLGGGLGIVNDSTLVEGCGLVELNFEREGDTTGTDTIQLQIGGTATPGFDYFPALPTQLIYFPGDTLITFPLTLPIDPDVAETIEITITQVATCGGVPLQSTTVFTIDQPPPLMASSMDAAILCNQSASIGAAVTGGLGFYSYLWDTGAITDSITVSPTVTTDYILTVMDTCGVTSISDTITVSIPNYLPLQLDVTSDTAIACLTNITLDTLSVTGGDSTYTYVWTDSVGMVLGNLPALNVAASAPTWYFLTATDGCGESVTDSVLVSTAILPPVQVFATDTVVPICIGDTVVLDANSVIGGNGVYTFEWLQNGNTISTTTPISVPVNNLLDYILVVNDQCGGSGTAQVTVDVPVMEALELEVLANGLICLGESVDLFAFVEGGSGFFNIEWPTILDSNGMPFTDPLLTVTPTDEVTFYPVWITDQCGQVVGDSTRILTEDLQTDIVVTQPGQDDVVLFSASDPPGQSFQWDLGDGTRLRGQNVSHSYLTIDQDFTVQLVVTTANGCMDTSVVIVEAAAHAYFPNAFTPDGDGINDVFAPVFNDLDLLELVIFDRWGREVFSSFDNGTTAWDGRVNGNEAAIPGVYVYWYRYAGNLLPNFDGFGHVTLAR